MSFSDQGFWKFRAEQAEKSYAINNSLAVVPWVPSNGQVGTMKEPDMTNPSFEPMEADEELATMEVEEETGYVGGEMDFANVNDIVGAGVNRVDDLRQQQWQQQHCMIPNIPPPKSSIPITWSW